MSIGSITMIGAGRVATHLALHLAERGTEIRQVYSRTMKSAEKLADKLGAMAVDRLVDLDHKSDLYIVAVVDDAIPGIVRQFSPAGKIVVHTSGSVAMDALQTASAHHGVFYPLQSFTHGREVDFSEIPLCIEASDAATESNLLELAKMLSRDVRLIDSTQRALIHVAAVFANNFSNFLFLQGGEILEQAGVSFDILLPLIRETVQRLNQHHPRETQTGPSVRNDEKTMGKHLNLIAGDPSKKEIYLLLSKYIQKEFNA
ncbi:MAG: Rossmann-like and DUF2520 domain-containing protein [Bacteroidales bacterium]